MPKNRPDYSVLVNKNEDVFKKIFESEFWRCEYTKRKYILDIRDRKSIQEYYFIKSSCGVDLVDHASQFVMYHADVALGIDGDELAPRNDMYEYLEQVIIAYHNYAYLDDPKYRIDDNTGFGFDLWELVDCLGEREIESINILHADARKYGFFPMDLIAIHPIEKAECLIADYVSQHGEFPFFQNSFLMEKKLDPDFHYKDRNGKQYFVEEKSENAVYVYIDCLNEKETIEKIYQRIIGLINMALKGKVAYVAGVRENSDVQICFYNKSIIQDKSKLKTILKYNLSAYRNWYDPVKFMLTDDTIKVSKYLMVPGYENVPFHKRAAGLWIWDQVHFHKFKLSDAIEKARKIKSLKIYDNIEYSSILRLYNLAKMSVEKMEVLKFSDL
ncbi:hypothetical protein SAMN05421830_108128 [Desulfomicrobium norvegicum]|uniref:Uncharacterized protein n=1 Tax=Desulfomicrobium norvegicum (strain DSM 1741 / NCIMB 8310) TaxID=52561 RepID=A0A8G2C407_DESNO|nr:hypothetical protein [Desulfomicrobium norvegicum]SFL88816.1 hypothetical protein SAMN05421830_108128 [Desulfomicrobium norvegicum]